MSGSPAPHGRALLVALTPDSRAALGAHEREITRLAYRTVGNLAGPNGHPPGILARGPSRGIDDAGTSTSGTTRGRRIFFW